MTVIFLLIPFDNKHGRTVRHDSLRHDILIEFYKNNPQIVQELRTIGSKQIAISAVTQGELYFGALNKAELRKIKKSLSPLTIVPVDSMISDKFIELLEMYALSHKLSIADALIASTAIVHSMKLYTLNVKDFRFIQGLTLHTP